jgi:hypothetical protein
VVYRNLSVWISLRRSLTVAARISLPFSLGPEAFLGLSVLESLDLSSNGLSTVPNEAFKVVLWIRDDLFRFRIRPLGMFRTLKKNYQKALKFLKSADAPQGSIVAGSKVTKTSYGKHF